MIIEQSLNENVLRFLTHKGGYMFRKSPKVTVFSAWNSVKDPYSSCGCHPDIVERLWNQIGATLPMDCRGLLYSNPALVHATSGVILGIALGTWYGLRLPGKYTLGAIEAGLPTRATFASGEMDIQQSLGEEWFFGAFSPQELKLCKGGYDIFSLP